MTAPDRIAGQWQDLRGRLRDTWGRLTEDDLAVENGNRDYVVAKVQACYGYSREEAESLVRDFEHTL
ncbi:MAG: CsbD family protein [Xanthomonadales bacterium]|nr:CsbD family protein [Xanthomonadales bacterium]